MFVKYIINRDIIIIGYVLKMELVIIFLLICFEDLFCCFMINILGMFNIVMNLLKLLFFGFVIFIGN